jgi:hypothetical protein
MCLTSSFAVRIMSMVYNATFNTISVISWRSVLLMEETGVPGENHRPVAGHPFPTLSKKTCINLIKNNIIFGVFHSPKRNNIPLGAIFVKHFPTAHPFGAPEFTPVFSRVRVTRSLVLYVCFVDRCLSFCTFSFWSLCCLFFFDIRILSTPLAFSSSS